MAEFIVDYPDDLIAEGYAEECINIHERIVRCRGCKRLIPKGEEFFIGCNKAERDACRLFSEHDMDYDWTSFFYVRPDDFCAWGAPMEHDTK